MQAAEGFHLSRADNGAPGAAYPSQAGADSSHALQNMPTTQNSMYRDFSLTLEGLLAKVKDGADADFNIKLRWTGGKWIVNETESITGDGTQFSATGKVDVKSVEVTPGTQTGMIFESN